MRIFTTRRFLPLFLTQFLGAFNDNLFKNALVMLVTFKSVQYSGRDAQTMVIAAGALFMLPYFLFSSTAGQYADKLERAKMARFTKLWELGIVILAAIGFLGHHFSFLLIMLFALGAQSTFFGPIKYALLPQHLNDDELLTGNAYIEAGTLLAILLGTISGGVLIMQPQGEWLVVLASLAIALGGYMASRSIPLSPAPQPNLKVNHHIVSSTWMMVSHDYQNPRVFRCIMGISWFWVVGAILLSQFPALVKEDIGANDSVVTLFLTLFSLGVGMGSYLSSLITRGKITSKFTVWAVLGMALFTFDAGYMIQSLPAYAGGELLTLVAFLSDLSHLRIAIDLWLMSVCAGVFIVPLYAIMQHDSEKESRARTIATNNIMNALCMVVTAGLTVVLLDMGFSIAQLFLMIGAGNVAVALYVRRLQAIGVIRN